MKKLAAFIFAALFAGGVFGATYYETVDGVTWTYSITDGEATIGREDRSAAISPVTRGDLTVPSTLGGCPVTTIGSGAFSYCSSLTSVTIPNSVTEIGTEAFRGCSSLTSITIPNSVTTIGNRAFYNCSSLATVTIPESVTTIGDYAFEGCSSLKEVHITDLAKWCAILFEDNWANPCYYAHHLYLNGEEIKDLVIPDSVTTIGSKAFEHCSSLTSVTIPEGVTKIGEAAFGGCSSLTSITIPDSVTTIGDYAFYSCRSLTTITIPNSVTTIGRHAFYDCRSLTSITIPDGVTEIGWSAFYGTPFYNNQPDGLVILGNGCLYKYKGTCPSSVTIPDSVTTIGSNAFADCSSLTSVTIPDSVTTIGSGAFSYCSSLTSVTIPNSVTEIGSEAFRGCSSLTSITIPNSVTTIGSGAFSDCSSLTSITIPNGVTTIGSKAFEYCSSLKSVTIPNSVTTIGERAFYYCSSLASITIPDGVTSIGDSAFYYCSSLVSITIPDGVTSIGDSAFYRCSSLTTITIPDSVTAIGSSVFGDCTSRMEFIVGDNNPRFRSINKMLCSKDGKTVLLGVNGDVKIPDCVTSIGRSAFFGCDSLTSVTIPDSVTAIGSDAFSYCSSLTSVTIPDGVTSIGGYAFYYCSSLASITIPDGVTSIGDSAFYCCSSLTTINIPSCLHGIGGSAFKGCRGLADASGLVIVNGVLFDYIGDGSMLEITSDVAVVDGNALSGVKHIQHLIIGGNVKEFKDGAFSYTVIDVLETNYPEQVCQAVGNAENASPFNNAQQIVVMDEDVSALSFTVKYKSSHDCDMCDDNGYWCEEYVEKNVKYGHTAYSPQVMCYVPWMEFSHWEPSISCVTGDIETSPILKKRNFNEFLLSDVWQWGSISGDLFEITDAFYDVSNACYRVQGTVNPELGNLMQSFDNYSSEQDTWSAKIVGYDITNQRANEAVGAVFYFGETLYWSCALTEYDNLDHLEIEFSYSLFEDSYTIWLDIPEETREIRPDIYTYTVEFLTGENWSYSSGDDLSYIVDEGDVVPHAPNVIVKDGWHFVGWDRDLEEPIMTNTIVRPICAPNTYSITYANYPAALGYELPEAYTYSEDCVLPEIADYSFGSELPDGTRASTYRFDGWTINGEKVDKIPAGTIGDVVVKFNSSLLVNFGDTEGPQPMPGFSHDTIVAWKGVAPTPKVMVTVEGRGELVEGQDFTVEYLDNDKVGIAKVIVRGKGDYIGTYTGSFTITKGSIVAEDERKDIFAWSPDNTEFAYDGTEKSIATIIAEDVDEVNVEVTGTTSAVNAGVYTASAKGTIKRFASDDYYNYTYVTTVDSTKMLTIKPRDLSGFAVELSGDVFFIDGSVRTPSIIVRDDGLEKTLVRGTDFDVEYSPITIGELTVTVVGKGNYKGTITRPFTILDKIENLPKPVIKPESKISGASVAVVINYAKMPGYETEIRYTFDGAEQTATSLLYSGKFNLPIEADTTIRAAAFLRGVRVSEIVSQRYLPTLESVIVSSGEGYGPVSIVTSGVNAWTLDIEERGYDGTPTMRSGRIGDDGISEMSATFSGDGVFEFWWKTSCEHDTSNACNWDRVECYLDGTEVARKDGVSGWTQFATNVVEKGEHTILWRYHKDEADEDPYPGDDCAWVDGVKFSFAAYIDFAADEEIVGELPTRIVSASGYSITLPEIGEAKYVKHVFSGWTYGGKVYQPGDLLVVDAQEMVVKPVWTEVLEVAYDLNGGSGNVPVTQQVISGGSVELFGIGEASLAKHAFGGWSLDGEIYSAGSEYRPVGDVTFSAVWVAKTLNTPTIIVASEHDDPTTVVEITSADGEVVIYYTIDGSEPNEENGTRYEGAFEVAGSVTIKAIAIKEDYFDSEVVEATVVSTYTPMSVGFDGGEGVVGTMPSAIETALRREIVLPEIGEARLPKHEFGGWTDGVNVYQPGDKYSIVDEICFSAVWTPKVLKAPVITVTEVYAGEKTSVVITTDDAEAEIRYTLDGSDPNMEGGLRYESTFDVVGTTTIKAILLRDDWFDSEIVETTTVRSWGTLNACLDNEQLVFTTGGDANWIGTSEEAYLGNTSACSGFITHNQNSWLETKVEGAGVLTFAIKVESEYSENRGHVIIYDGLTNLVDSVAKELIGGNIEWTIKTLEIEGDGEHTIRWVYAKDDRDEEWCGRDCAWIDAIVWTPKSTRPDAVEGASEETKAAFDQWILAYKVENPSAANVNAFILGLEPTATEEAIQEKVEEELANLDLGKLVEGDIPAAVAEIQAKYPNAKVDLAPVDDLNTSAHLYKLVIKLK